MGLHKAICSLFLNPTARVQVQVQVQIEGRSKMMHNRNVSVIGKSEE